MRQIITLFVSSLMIVPLFSMELKKMEINEKKDIELDPISRSVGLGGYNLLDQEKDDNDFRVVNKNVSVPQNQLVPGQGDTVSASNNFSEWSKDDAPMIRKYMFCCLPVNENDLECQGDMCASGMIMGTFWSCAKCCCWGIDCGHRVCDLGQGCQGCADSCDCDKIWYLQQGACHE